MFHLSINNKDVAFGINEDIAGQLGTGSCLV
jgi:hypothetical protein